MNIEVTVNTEGIDLSTPVDSENHSYDLENDEVYSRPVTLGELVARKVMLNVIADDKYPLLRKKFLQIRDEEIRAQIVPIVAAVINGPIQRTNS